MKLQIKDSGAWRNVVSFDLERRAAVEVAGAALLQATGCPPLDFKFIDYACPQEEGQAFRTRAIQVLQSHINSGCECSLECMILLWIRRRRRAAVGFFQPPHNRGDFRVSQTQPDCESATDRKKRCEVRLCPAFDSCQNFNAATAIYDTSEFAISVQFAVKLFQRLYQLWNANRKRCCGNQGQVALSLLPSASFSSSDINGAKQSCNGTDSADPSTPIGFGEVALESKGNKSSANRQAEKYSLHRAIV